MPKYHINPETDRINICRAKIKCDFTVNGIEPPHYYSKDEAKKASEQNLEKKYSLVAESQKKRNKGEIPVDDLLAEDHLSKNFTNEDYAKANRDLNKKIKGREKLIAFNKRTIENNQNKTLSYDYDAVSSAQTNLKKNETNLYNLNRSKTLLNEKHFEFLENQSEDSNQHDNDSDLTNISVATPNTNSIAKKDPDFIPNPPMKKVKKEYSEQLAPYKDLIESGTTARAYTHPQGKVAILDKFDNLTVYKNGVAVPSSLTKNVDKLLNNETVGRWEEVGLNEATDAVGDEVVHNDNADRKQKLVSNGYPSTSHFDTRKDNLTFTKKKTSQYDKSSILPTATRVNPHQSLDNEYLDTWGEDTSIEVWKDNTGRNVLVAGSGKSPYEIGSKGEFQHDQSFARIGSSWTLVGAFENIKGGQAVGEIPNKKTPLYTYK